METDNVRVILTIHHPYAKGVEHLNRWYVDEKYNKKELADIFETWYKNILSDFPGISFNLYSFINELPAKSSYYLYSSVYKQDTQIQEFGKVFVLKRVGSEGNTLITFLHKLFIDYVRTHPENIYNFDIYSQDDKEEDFLSQLSLELSNYFENSFPYVDIERCQSDIVYKEYAITRGHGDWQVNLYDILDRYLRLEYNMSIDGFFKQETNFSGTEFFNLCYKFLTKLINKRMNRLRDVSTELISLVDKIKADLYEWVLNNSNIQNQKDIEELIVNFFDESDFLWRDCIYTGDAKNFLYANKEIRINTLISYLIQVSKRVVNLVKNEVETLLMLTNEFSDDYDFILEESFNQLFVLNDKSNRFNHMVNSVFDISNYLIKNDFKKYVSKNEHLYLQD